MTSRKIDVSVNRQVVIKREKARSIIYSRTAVKIIIDLRLIIFTFVSTQGQSPRYHELS